MTVSSPAVTSGSINTVSGNWIVTPSSISQLRFRSRNIRSTSARSARVLQPSTSRESTATWTSTVSPLAFSTAMASVKYNSRCLLFGFTCASAGHSFSGEQREINEINSAIYCFTLEKLWPALAKVKPNNKHRELYLTDAIAVLNAKGETVLVQVAVDSREVLGCNTRADLAEVDRIFRERKRNALMDAGVTIQLPETVLIDPDVTAGEDTIIEPGVQLLGK